MKTTVRTSSDVLNILLIGNNPIELGTLLEKLSGIRSRKIVTETAFDLRSCFQRLVSFQPEFILIDDNIGHSELTQTVDSLAQHVKTRQVPITIIKNSNYEEALSASEIADFLLKKTITSESLYSAILNTLKFRRTRQFLADAYAQRKQLLQKLSGI